jgi:hypothetical protein
MAENARLFAAPVPLALWDDLRRERLIDDAAPTPGEETLD